MTVARVALLSLEPWDEVWRRNQHLAAELVRQGLVEHLLFVEPPGNGSRQPHEPLTGITVVPTSQRMPKRLGGTALRGRRLRRDLLRDVDLLWINDPTLGASALRRGQAAVYDVTDDWRMVPTASRESRRVIRAETLLAGRAKTVVCSEVLRRRWWDRYGLRPAVVHNAVDEAAWSRGEHQPLDGPGPHLGYVGTLHDERLDVPLVIALADGLDAGTVHLVGPSSLTSAATARLEAHERIRLHGPVAAETVPAVIKGLDVLICPHRVTPFTLSLDAIKSYEYVASGRPIVATPTSGFQALVAPQLTVAGVDGFVAAAQAAMRVPPVSTDTTVATWAQRAREFRAAWPC